MVEAVALGLPVGIGSFTSGENRLDSQLAGAVMGIQAIKGGRSATGSRPRAVAAAKRTTRCIRPRRVARSTNRAAAWRAA
ncbi:chorismate synthase family protein [Mycobacterium xenopi 4042]|uniref:chorismate synthase n=1 Tax=Mycobacterium xenopi 4042 TaxID=1299334 RepID=X8DCV6_MYCXE|nr:chorismate synthase family protein [Mycobacterium xenopi 4042]